MATMEVAGLCWGRGVATVELGEKVMAAARKGRGRPPWTMSRARPPAKRKKGRGREDARKVEDSLASHGRNLAASIIFYITQLKI
jgi:hypothetical protein